MNLILFAGSNRSQAINLIKEDDGGTSLIRLKNEQKWSIIFDVMYFFYFKNWWHCWIFVFLKPIFSAFFATSHKRAAQQHHIALKLLLPAQTAASAASRTRPPTCWGSQLLSSWRRTPSRCHGCIHWPTPGQPVFSQSLVGHRTDNPWKKGKTMFFIWV